jgi:ADP-ribosyl-[dinitrogen reductase] hydrolase
MTNVLLGGSIGDALGVFAESKPANYPPLLIWDHKTFLGSEHHNLKPGEWSDDTQLSCLLAQSLIDCQGFNPDEIAQRYIVWFFSGTARGYGRTTKTAMDNLKAHVHWSKSGVVGSYGNGTFMRAAPFAVYFRNDLKSLIEAATIDAKITHNSDEAIAGSLAMVLSVFHILNDNDQDLIPKILPYLPNSEVKNKLSQIPDMLQSQKLPTDILQIIGNKADVRITAPTALYCFLKFRNYPDAVIAAICNGGDTDTAGATTGNLCAAKYGIKGIPSYWVEQIEDRDKIISLDNQLYNRSGKPFFPRS